LITGVPKGTIYHQWAGGGGGYGDPRKRPAELVAEEVRNGVVSTQSSREVYGVVVDEDTMKLDEVATQSIREKPEEEST
jgi:N-methylhydantoinase B